MIDLANLLKIKHDDLGGKDLSSLKTILSARAKKRDDTIKCANRLYNKFKPYVKVFHYPRTDGKMAHQVNYGVKKSKYFLKTDDSTIFAIYNADSKPDKLTFDYVNSVAPKDNSFIFQQHGNYLKNYHYYNCANIRNAILFSAAQWQTKWSLGVELFNALLQAPAKKLPSWAKRYLYPANYCVGHGLFITQMIYEKIGGLSETTYNEDAEFGLELSYFEIPITPIPFFDLSDSPNSIKSLYIQKSGWFFNPLQAFSYYSLINNKYKNTKMDRIKLFSMSFRFFLYAAYWLMGPVLFLSILLSSLLDIAFLYWFISAYFGYLIIPTMFSWVVINNLDLNKTFKVNKTKPILDIIMGSGLAYLLHGMSAYRTLLLIIKKKLFGTEIIKNKTETTI